MSRNTENDLFYRVSGSHSCKKNLLGLFWEDVDDMFHGFGGGRMHKLEGNDMETSSKNFTVLFMVVAALFGVSNVGFALPALSVTPSVISNTYPGVITLNITGLTNTEKVTIQKWLDGNGNGLIDAGEPMIDTFNITDGGASIIGGITNINVPFDSNPTNGAITTTLNCPAALLLDNMVGHYVFRLVSPTGRFSPVTATFAVTNATLGQSISGIIYSNGVTPFPYAVVVAQDQQANNPAGATVADATGHFFLTLPSSSYTLIAGMPSFYYDQSVAPSVILTNGMAATNNLYLTNGTVTISGNVYDATNSNGIGGLMLLLQSGSLFAIAFTDTNGNYSAAVTPSFWKIKAVKQRLTRRAYVFPEATFQVDATGGNVTNANIALPKGNALFYGRVTDISNTPYANIEIDGSTGNGSTANSYDSKGYSDANGYYTVAVLGDLTNYWSCSANDGKNSTLLANYILNTFANINFAPNQVTLENFIALPATATISGHVQSNTNSPVTGVGLNASATIGGNNYQSVDGTTDNSGNYSLAVAPGTWNVELFTGGGFSDSLDTHGYVDLTEPHIVSIPPTNAVLNITVYPLGTPLISSPQRLSPTQFGFTINGAMNVNYTVQVSTNLASTNWASLFSLQFTNDAVFVTDQNATNSPRFYRVRKN
jgi:hypothetical protein